MRYLDSKTLKIDIAATGNPYEFALTKTNTAEVSDQPFTKIDFVPIDANGNPAPRQH